MTDNNDENQPDRPFNSFRVSTGVKARELVADVINQYQSYEKAHGLRKRARKAKVRILVEMITCSDHS